MHTLLYMNHVELGTTWFILSEHFGWLRRACSTKGLTHYKELFQSAVSALRRELQASIVAGELFLPVAMPFPVAWNLALHAVVFPRTLTILRFGTNYFIWN